MLPPEARRRSRRCKSFESTITSQTLIEYKCVPCRVQFRDRSVRATGSRGPSHEHTPTEHKRLQKGRPTVVGVGGTSTGAGVGTVSGVGGTCVTALGSPGITFHAAISYPTVMHNLHEVLVVIIFSTANITFETSGFSQRALQSVGLEN